MKKSEKLKRRFSYLVDQQCSYTITVNVKDSGHYPIEVTDGWSGTNNPPVKLMLSKAMALKLSAILFTSAIDLPTHTGEYPGCVLPEKS